jgi:hypothetical protein
MVRKLPAYMTEILLEKMRKMKQTNKVNMKQNYLEMLENHLYICSWNVLMFFSYAIWGIQLVCSVQTNILQIWFKNLLMLSDSYYTRETREDLLYSFIS